MRSLFGALPAKLLAGAATSTNALARRPAVASAQHAARFRVLMIALISLLGVRDYSPALRRPGTARHYQRFLKADSRSAKREDRSPPGACRGRIRTRHLRRVRAPRLRTRSRIGRARRGRAPQGSGGPRPKALGPPLRFRR